MNLKDCKLLFLFSLSIVQANCQSSSRVGGIGVGTFIIILAILFSIVWCLVCRTSSRPEMYSVIGILVPVILILVFVLMPKEINRDDDINEITDMNFVTHVVFMVIAIIAFVLSCLVLCQDYFFIEKKAKNIARSAFVLREE